MGRLYGINVVNLFPWAYGPSGMKRAVKLAKKAGFDGIQFLPLRGWKTSKKEDYEDSVISYQAAWSSGSLWKRLYFQRSSGQKLSLLLRDWFLFSNSLDPNFNHATYCTPFMDPPVFHMCMVTEIHPEIGTDIQTYVDFCKRGGRLCWDTWHVVRKRAGIHPGIKSWRELLNSLPADAIGLIHVHLFPKELESFLCGCNNAANMLKELKRKAPKAPAIIEIEDSELRLPKDMVEYLSEIRKATKKYLD